MTIRQDLKINQGETWSWVYTHIDSTGSAIDLTGYTARMSVKTNFTGSTEAYLSTGADADGGIISLGGVVGTVTLSMTAAQTTALTDNSSLDLLRLPQEEPIKQQVKLRYDLELVSGAGDVTRALEGWVTVSREITG